MTNKITINIINAFTDAGEGGNPAGVVYPADEFTKEDKQKIAAKVGLSETAFVSRSQSAEFKLDFFTPNKQIAHCGHATIATFSYLSQQGLVKGPKSSKETIDGNRDIYLKGEVAYMQQLAPKYFPLPYKGISEQDVLASLHLQKTDLLAGHNPMPVNTGNSFMMIPVKDEATLKAIHPDLNAIHQISEALDLIGYYPFTLETQVRGRDAATRMFAPYYGIPEEAATGMAAGPLACYLFDQINIKKETLILEQGRLMPTPSPSEILVELKLEDGSIKSLLAGGRAKVTRSIEIELD